MLSTKHKYIATQNCVLKFKEFPVTVDFNASPKSKTVVQKDCLIYLTQGQIFEVDISTDYICYSSVDELILDEKAILIQSDCIQKYRVRK